MITKELIQALFSYMPNGSLVRKVTTNPRAKQGTISGCLNKAGYLRTTVAGRLYYNHHLVWLLFHGYLPKMLDHINGDRADNRIENLRECTQEENMRNCRNKKNNTTGIKGVTWRPTKGKFRARITVDQKEVCIGHYDTLEEASQAVQQARTTHHGAFARHE